MTGYGPQAARWTELSGPAELRALARAADRLGYSHLTCSEHVATPIGPTGSTRYYDPLATFGFMAAVTERIRFVTHVLVMPAHHPLALAKQYGTLDRLSGGRVTLGVGLGILKAEFDALGISFAGRIDLYSESLEALRAALNGPEPAYQGNSIRFGNVVVDPCAIQAPVPIWLGGRSTRSLRLAIRYADGWDPFALSPEALGVMLGRIRRYPQWPERSEPFDVVVLRGR